MEFSQVLCQLVRLNIPNAHLIYTCIQNERDIAIATVGVRHACWKGHAMKEAQILEKGKNLRRSRVIGKGRDIGWHQQAQGL